jgi:hypothetical protein
MDMDVSPLCLWTMVQMQQGRYAGANPRLKKAMDMQESASAALLNAVAGNLPLASGGSVGTQVNTLV